MKKIRRLLCLMICLSLLLCACDGGGETGSSVEPSSEPASETASSNEPSAEESSEPVSEPETDPLKDFVPVFRAAVCSDTHISYTSSTEAKRLAQLFQSTYKYAASHETYKTFDALFVAGDLTNSGGKSEYDAFKKVVADNIKDETTLITVMGNHEYYGGNQQVYLDNMDDSLDKHVVVNGYHFIGLSTPDEYGSYTSEQVKWLKEQLAEAAAADPDKPIFTFQHHHIQNTVYVSKTWYTPSSAALNAAFAKYPQVFNFSGHSHGPINNPISIWQTKYTLLGTGTLSYFEMETGMTYGTLPPNKEQAAQFYIIEVDKDNRVRILPYDLITDDFFKTPSNDDDPKKQLVYSIDNLKDPSSFLYTSARGKTAASPYFAEGAAVTVSKIKTTSVKITIPQALDDSSMYNYRIVCTPKDGSRKTEYKYFAEYYFEPMPETQEYTLSGLLDTTEYTVDVYPVNVWGKEGDPISAKFTTLEDKPVIYESENEVNYSGTFTNFDSLKTLALSDTNYVYGGKIAGDVFAGDWCSSSVLADVKAALAEGKGYNGSTALSVMSDASAHGNRGVYVFATDDNGNTTAFPRFNYLRVWVDFTGIDFRKACFGLVTPEGGLYSTDDLDGRSDLEFYYLADGTDEWKTYYHGGDGCFGAAQSSTVKDFKGWLAFPVKDFASRNGGGELYPSNETVGVYMYWDYNTDAMLGTPFYLDELQLVADYKTFEEYKK